jgi:hypothetical protein
LSPSYAIARSATETPRFPTLPSIPSPPHHGFLAHRKATSKPRAAGG